MAFQTHQDFIIGARFHPMDNNLIIIHGRGLLSLWTRRKDGIFTKSLLLDVSLLILFCLQNLYWFYFLKEQANKTITAIEFSSSGDLITGDSDGTIAVWTVDVEGQYFVKLEYVVRKNL